MASSTRARSPAGSVAGSSRGERSERHDDKDNGPRVENYYGDRFKLKFFMAQLKTFFSLNRAKYSDSRAQVLYASMCLRGPAFSWFEPILNDQLKGGEKNQETVNIFGSLEGFEIAIQQVFGVADEGRTAERVIHQLRQEGTAARYWSQFQQVASKLKWEDKALKAIFYAGLKTEVKEKLINNQPQTYQHLVQTAIRVDNELYELRRERGGRSGRPYRSYGTGFSGGRTDNHDNLGDPMDLSAMTERSSRPKQRGKQGRGGNNAERERRRRDNLCYNCGKSGHQARDCKGASHTLHMMTVKTDENKAGMVGKKADTTMGTRKQSHERVRPTAQKEPDTRKDHVQGKPNTPTKTTIPHEILSWTACYDDSCLIHQSEKDGSGWYPTRPKNHGKKKRNAPSWYQPQASDQESDTPLEYGFEEGSDKDQIEGHDSLQMMNAKYPGKGPRKGKKSQEEPQLKDHCEFTVLHNTGTCMVFRTRHYGLKTEGGIRYPTFWPTGAPGAMEQDVVIRRCVDWYCQYREAAHSHDVLGQEFLAAEGAGLFPPRMTLNLMKAIATDRRAPSRDKKKGKGSEQEAEDRHAQKKKLGEKNLAERLQEELDKKEQRRRRENYNHVVLANPRIVNPLTGESPKLIPDSDSEYEEVVTSEYFPQTEPVKQKEVEEELAEATSVEGETETYSPEEPDLPDPGTDRKFIVVSTTRTSITMVTNYWRRIRCEDSGCYLDNQHVHAIFDPTMVPRDFLRIIVLDYCCKEDCDYAPELHIHQGSDSAVADLQIPEQIAQRIWGHVHPTMEDIQPYGARHAPLQFNMMVERLGFIETVISEIEDEEYIAEYFECESTGCDMYFVNHKHSFNVDPEHPNIPIKPHRMRKMKQQGCVCDKQGCEWRQYLHVHFPKNL